MAVERRSAEGRPEQLEALAAELLALNVDVIIAAGTSAVIAAKRSTTSTPIVIAGASDPVAFGLVASLAHPGGNITGLSDSPGREIEAKRLQLLKAVVPTIDRIGVVLDSTGRRDPRPMQQAAKLLGIGLL
ncbi:MAG TPA: ABC transporter substrate binding protein, partial [Methylomirabilota bacterium]|nr:ABC transporter substrate binding protein [Methylomirabilota bacterium]